MTTINITYHNDKILNVDRAVREWLDERLMGHLTVAVRDDDLVYACPDGRPLRLGANVPTAPCGWLPGELVDRAALWLVADVDLPDFHSGLAHRLRPSQRDPEMYPIVRERFEAYVRKCVDAHLAEIG